MASRRAYATIAQVLAVTGLTVTDADITLAEQIIDQFVGYQDMFLDKDFANSIEGLVSSPASSTTQFTPEQRHSGIYQNNFFSGCEVEFLGGTGGGQRTVIASSDYLSGVITFRDALTTPVDGTSAYRIYQLAKFPRKKDVYLDALHNPNQYFKNIPVEIRDATIAQVEYMKLMPSQFFTTDDMFKNSERIGDYMYQKARDGSGDTLSQMIAPKAKIALVGFINRKGQIIT